jgi:D-amino-acid dehydrogenase
MKTIVLGAGIVGTATAYFLAKQGHEVEVVERQSGAALETSFGNGGVIHASEVEPWSQPGMPGKIMKWLGKEDAPLLVRYGAIPHMWRWGLGFIANCTPERFRRNSLTNLKLALHSLKILQQIRAETGIEYDLRTVDVLKIYTSAESFAAGSSTGRPCPISTSPPATGISAGPWAAAPAISPQIWWRDGRRRSIWRASASPSIEA